MSNVLLPPAPPTEDEWNEWETQFDPIRHGYEPMRAGHLVGKVVLEERIEGAIQQLINGEPLNPDEEALLDLIDDDLRGY